MNRIYCAIVILVTQVFVTNTAFTQILRNESGIEKLKIKNPIVGNPILYWPKVYEKSNEKYTNLGMAEQELDSPKMWEVYSDRDSNVTYWTPDRNTTNSILWGNIPMMHRFWVVGKSGNYLRVAKASYEGGYGAAIGLYFDSVKGKAYVKPDFASSIDYGYINRENVLLWNKSWHSVNNNSTIIKGIIIPRVFDSNLIKDQGIKVYSDPEQNTVTQQFCTFKPVFVYKKIGRRYLVGEMSSLNDSTLKIDPETKAKPKFGWIDSNDFQLWNTTVCVDINNDSLAQVEMKALQFHPTWFDSSKKARKWANNYKSATSKINMNYDNFCKSGFEVKPVLIDIDSNGVMLISGLNSYFEGSYADRQQKMMSIIANDTLIKLRRRTNVIVAIDFDNLRDDGVMIIRQIISVLSNANRAMRVENTPLDSLKFGGVIYFSSRSIKRITFTSRKLMDSAEFINWLTDRKLRLEKETPTQGGYNTVFNALDSGIELLSKYAINAQCNTNMFVLLGGRSDTGADCDRRIIDLSIKMSRQNVNVFAYQLSSLSRDYYPSFSSHIGSIIRNIEKLCNKNNTTADTASYYKPNKDRKNLFELSNSKDVPIVGSYMFPLEIGNPISRIPTLDVTAHLYTKFKNSRNKDVTSHEKVRSFIVNDYDASHDSDNAQIIWWQDMVREIKMKILKDTVKIQQLNTGLARFMSPVYTSYKVVGLKYPVYKRYLFVSQAEYRELIRRYENVTKALSDRSLNNETKLSHIRGALCDVIANYFGGRQVISPDYLLTLTNKALLDVVRRSKLSNPNLTKLVSNFDNTHLLEWKNIFQNSVKQLHSIEYSEKYIFYSGGSVKGYDRFYWIPEDNLLVTN